MKTSTEIISATDEALEAMRNALKPDAQPLPPTKWVDIGLLFAVHMANCGSALAEAEMDFNKEVSKGIKAGESVAAAEVHARTTESFRKLKELKVKIDAIDRAIPLCRAKATLSDNEYNRP